MSADRAPRFIGADVAQAVHDRQLAEHGGLVGLKDIGLLESALARPINKFGYGETDPCALAAAYAQGAGVDKDVRVLWLGDSHTNADFLSGSVRDAMLIGGTVR